MKRMITALVILTIITVLLLAVVNSIARNRSYEYKPIVSYSSQGTEIAEFKPVEYQYNNYNYYNYGEINFFGQVFEYERVILFSSIVLVILFSFIFFNVNTKKK